MNVNKWILGAVGAVSLGFAAIVGVQIAPQNTPAAQRAETQPAAPALWVVRDEDTTIYLFGTVHVLRPGLSWFDDAVRQAFDASDQLVLELVMPDDATARDAIRKHAMATDATPQVDRLPADQRQPYIRSLANAGLPQSAFDQYQPWFAATNLSVLTLAHEGYDANSGAEKILSDAAGKSGKPVIGLETMEQQLGFFSGLSKEAQTALLASTVEQLPQAAEMTDAMVAAWAGGDPQGLARIMNDSLRDSPELSKTLLADRNRRWADWIIARLEQPGTVFVAVGAGHLAGADSVQAILGQRGLAAERLASR